MANTLPPVEYATIAGRFMVAGNDSEDPGLEPDIVPAKARGRIFPSVSHVLVAGSTPPATVKLAAVDFELDLEGYISNPVTKERTVQVVAPTDAVNPKDFTYRIDFDPGTFQSFDFSVPAGGTIDLTNVGRVARSEGIAISRGEPGVGIDAVVLSPDESSLQFTYNNGVVRIVPVPALDQARQARDQAVQAAQTATAPTSTAIANEITNPNSEARAALNATYPPIPKDASVNPLTGAVHLSGFAGKGGDDGPAIAAALAAHDHLLGREGQTYRIASTHVIPLAPGRRVRLDFQNARIECVNGGSLIIGNVDGAPVATVDCPAGAIYGTTHITVSDASQIVEGDLITIRSPVEWVAGIPLEATYIVGDVEQATGKVWVEGQILTEITPAQITAAGKTGGVTVQVFKPAALVEVVNGTIASDRTGAGTLLQITGARRVNTSSLHVDAPTRMGVTVSRVGVWFDDKSSVTRAGYVFGDQGYVNASSSPGGSSFGYGFMATHTYFAHVRGAHSFSGWHGYDFARGVTYALVDGCVAHRDAYGWSSHEGCWRFHVKGSVALGGQGIMNRSPELVIEASRLTTYEHAVSSSPQILRLEISDSTLRSTKKSEVHQGDNVGFPEYCFPAGVRPVVSLSNIRSPQAGLIQLNTRGDVHLADLQRFGSNADTGENCVIAIGNGVDSVLSMAGWSLGTIRGQRALGAKDFKRVSLADILHSGDVTVPSGSALVNLLSTDPNFVCQLEVENATVRNLEYIARVTSGATTMRAVRTTGAFRLLLGAATSSVRHALWNAVTAPGATPTIVAGGATVANQVGTISIAAA